MSKVKFHLNENGEAKKCSAKPGNCPITKENGGDHYDSVKEAQSDYERKQNIFANEKSLSNFVDPEKFSNMVEEGYISERKHPDDDTLRVYSYTPKTQFSGHWTPETLLARGLILKTPENGDLSKANIHARALGKFFTVEQMTEGDWTNLKLIDDDENVTIKEHDPIDFDSPAVVSEKMNGALGVGYIDKNNNLTISTKGSFESTEAEIGTKILDKYDRKGLGKYLKRNMKNKTPLFEIISPERLHPVDYGDMEDVILLGTVDNKTGEWEPVDKEHHLAQEFSFQTSERLEAQTLREAFEMPYRDNTEGMVVTTKDPNGVQKMYKVKPQEYHELRASFYKLKKGKVDETVKYIKNDDVLKINSAEDVDLQTDSNVKKYESFAKNKIFKEYVQPVKTKITESNNALDKFLKNNNTDINDPELRKKIGTASKDELGYEKGFMFSALDDRINGGNKLVNSVKESVLKDIKNSKK